MACSTKEFENNAKENNVELNENKLNELKKKGSKPSDRDLFDTLPTSEQVVSLDSAFTEKLFEYIVEDIVSKGKEEYDLFLENSKVFIESITEYVKSLPDDQKLKIRTFESNNGTYGEFNNNHNGDDVINIAVDTNSVVSTKSEALFHELVHSVAKGAFNLDNDLRRKVRDLKEIVQSFETNKEMFYPLDEDSQSEMTKDDILDAQEKYDYVMDENSDLEEFIAYYVSNPSFQQHVLHMVHDFNSEAGNKISPFKPKDKNKKKREKSKYNGKKINKNIVEKIFGKYKEELGDEIAKNFNNRNKNKASDSTREEDGITSINKDMVDSIIKFRSKTLTSNDPSVIASIVSIRDGSIVDKFTPDIVKNPYNFSVHLVDNVAGKGYSRAMKSALVRKIAKHAKVISNTIKNQGMKHSKKALKVLRRVKIIDNILRSELFTDLWRQYVSSESDDANGIFYKISRKSEKIRANIEGVLKNAMSKLDVINTNLNTEDSLDAHSVLKTMYRGEMYKNVEYLMSGNLSRKNIQAALENELDKTDFDEDKIEYMKSVVEYAMNGSTDLKGKSPIISSVLGEMYDLEDAVSGKVVKKKVARDSDRFMTTYAMTFLSDADIAILNKMASKKKIKESVVSTAKAYRGRKETLEKSYFLNGYRSKIPFGHIDRKSKKILTYVDKSEARSLLSKGVYGGIVKGKEVTVLGKKMVLMYSMDTSPSFSDGILKLSNEYNPAISLTNVMSNSSKISKDGKNIISNSKDRKDTSVNIKDTLDIVKSLFENVKRTDEQIKAVEKSIGFKISELIPILDSSGKIIDFEVQIDHNTKEKYLEYSNDAQDMIYESLFSLVNARASKSHNTMVIDKLLEHSVSPEIGSKDDDYIDVLKHEMFKGGNILFGSIYGEELYVKKELIPVVFGAKRASLANINIFGYQLGSKPFKKALSTFEEVLSNVSGKYKQIIAMFTPDVVIGNFASNMYVAKEKGIDFEDYAVEFKRNWTELNELNDKIDKRNELKADMLSSPADAVEIQDKINKLTYAIENHPAYSLFNDGQLLPSMEDIDTDESGLLRDKFNGMFYSKGDDEYKKLIIDKATQLKGDSDLPLSSFIKEAKKKIKKERLQVPTVVKNIAKISFIDSDTTLGKKGKKFLMYGDAITKKIILDHYKKEYLHKHGKEMPQKIEEKNLDELAELFVSYSTQETGVQKWIENIGMVMFMKYQFRTTKGYLKHLMKNKARGATGHLSQVLFNMDVPDPLDSNFKNGPIDALINKTKLDNLDEVGGEIITPHILGLI